jgi:dGTPase
MPRTLEGQVARLSDRIAYVHHDTDDAIRAGLITESEVPAEVRSVLGERRGQWLGRLVMDVVESSVDLAVIKMTGNVRVALNTLKDFLSERVYQGPVNAAEIRKAQRLLAELFNYYVDHPDQVSPEYRELMQQGEPALRVVGDFLAGMTDRYAIRLAESLLIPRTWAF